MAPLLVAAVVRRTSPLTAALRCSYSSAQLRAMSCATPSPAAAPAPAAAGSRFTWPAGAALGFIGAGAMASAIARGIGEAKLLPYTQMHLSDLYPEIASDLKSRGAHVGSSNSDVVQVASVLVLATKPDAALPALQKERALLEQRKPLIISIAAGITIAALESALPPGARVVRVMPNTPSLVGAGASGFALGQHATDADAQIVTAILSSIGVALRVAEKDLDAVTGVSGSGPAYVFMFIEALADGGVRAGLTRTVAHQLAVQTVLGSAQLVRDTQRHPAQLKDQVASPGGTTIAAIHALENGGFRGVVMDAVLAAARRATEMGQPHAKPDSKL